MSTRVINALLTIALVVVVSSLLIHVEKPKTYKPPPEVSPSQIVIEKIQAQASNADAQVRLVDVTSKPYGALGHEVCVTVIPIPVSDASIFSYSTPSRHRECHLVLRAPWYLPDEDVAG